MTRLIALLALVSGLLAAPLIWAQYPTRPIRLVVLALSENLGQTRLHYPW